MPSVGRKRVARPRRGPIDSSLAVAAVGALSAALAVAFTTPPAAVPRHHHHDRCPQSSSGGPRSSGSNRLRPQRQRQHHACHVSRGEPLSSPGSELPAAVLGVGGGRRRGRVRQRGSASFGNTGERTVADELRWAVVAPGDSRPEWYLCGSGAGEATAVADEEEVRLEEQQEGGKSTTRAFRQRDDLLQRHRRRRQEEEQGAAETSAAETKKKDGGGVKKKRRRPPAYWSDDENLRNEVVKFWADLGVASDKIPNQTLMHFFRAHALKYGVAMRGGVDDCAEWLNVEAIPGKWSLALLEREVAQLLEEGKLGSKNVASGPQGGGSELIKIATKGWPSREALEMGNRASATKHMLEKCAPGYWTTGNNFEREVLTFNTNYQLEEGLPAVWMVKLIDMINNGRRDIVNAIQRAGGYDPAVERLGLVHHIEWKSFADQLETLRELKEFLTVDGVLQKRMPTLTAFNESGRGRLRKKIVLLGGRKLLARKMGLQYKPKGKEGVEEIDGLHFGNFDLGFAVDVLEYVYEQELRRSPVPKPPVRKKRRPRGSGQLPVRSRFHVRSPAIMLPRRDHMLAGGAKSVKLVEQIEFYGGYEHVARRLNLGYHYEDELQYQDKVRDELKLQNEQYGKMREINLAKQRNKLAKLRVRLQSKRAKYERQLKLADGLRRVPGAGQGRTGGQR